MSLEELVLKYGVFGGIRYKEPEKKYFLSNISQDFKELGYEVKILQKDLKRFSGINCYIGDVVNAKTLVIANYDTPINSLNPKLKYFPFNARASEKEITEKPKFRAVTTILTGAVIMFLSSMVFELNTTLLKVVWISVSLVMMLIAYLFLNGTPNKVNANFNTSGVLGLLEIAKSHPKDTAFILTDRANIDNLGDAMVQEALPKSLSQKEVIYLNAIGRGESIVISYTEGNTKLAKKLAKKNKKSKLFMLDKDGLYKNSLEYYPKSVAITVATEFNGVYEIENIFNENDVKIDEDKFYEVVNMVVEYLK